jgi:hypothetical protein
LSYPDRIDLVALPPCDLITLSVECAMVTAAQRDYIFITDPAAERAGLSEPNMMGVTRPPSADQARLPRHEPEVRDPDSDAVR